MLNYSYDGDIVSQYRFTRSVIGVCMSIQTSQHTSQPILRFKKNDNIANTNRESFAYYSNVSGCL